MHDEVECVHVERIGSSGKQLLKNVRCLGIGLEAIHLFSAAGDSSSANAKISSEIVIFYANISIPNARASLQTIVSNVDALVMDSKFY